MQDKITIINVKRSTPNKTFQQTIFLTAWKNKEASLRTQGWIPKEDIENLEYDEVEDGLGMESVEVVEEKEEVKEEGKEESNPSGVDYSKLNLKELKSACDEKGIKYHHASKEKKLISLLQGE